MNTTAPAPRPVVKITTKFLAYMGSRAYVTVEHHDRNRVGLRTITVQWIDAATEENGGWPAGSVTRKVIKGDGRLADFQVIEAEELIS